MNVICILGNQLFSPKLLPLKPSAKTWVFMREDRALCTHFRYHKHKIIFFLSAMRKYAKELRDAGYQVHYEKLGESEDSFESRLTGFLALKKCRSLDMFEIEDKFFETSILGALAEASVELKIHSSPMFLTSREIFPTLVGRSKKPFMKTFYEAQRKRLKILVTLDGLPVGGKWSFDEDNRKALPKGHKAPSVPSFKPDSIDREVFVLVAKEFGDHPGVCSDFWLPTGRVGARSWAKDFFEKRFGLFGPYEDAMSKDDAFLYHSVLTPYLNTGLLTPRDCVSAALKKAEADGVPLNSCEGFIRQIIGWREFIRGIYQNLGERQEGSNFFGHSGKLTSLWYSGETGIPPLDDVIGKVNKYAYAHHIERLMVVGSLMVLLEVDPKEGYRWFMEMFIDSSDWVMVPNVFGMALFADGGIFAPKPYICGSNYYRKMSGYKAGEWCEGVDGLYWMFVRKNKKLFLRNPRTSMTVRTLEKMPAEKIARLELAANKLRQRLVTP